MACQSNHERTAQVKLKVNGEEIELNEFVESLIAESVIGMVKSLRGVGKIDAIDLNIAKKPIEYGSMNKKNF
jgi:hypothetical protein